uniref:YybH family protein n=1 Tax=Roseovarius indicus TaxID=540747 RepID=UPI003B52ED1A
MKHILQALILLLFSLPATAQDNPIVARMHAFQAAFNAGNAEAVAGFYTENAALFPPRSGNVVGRAAITAHYAQAFQAGVGGLQLDILEIRQHGPDTAIEIGETMVDAGAQRIHGRYLHVWAREGATWRLSRDIFNVIGTSAR